MRHSLVDYVKAKSLATYSTIGWFGYDVMSYDSVVPVWGGRRHHNSPLHRPTQFHPSLVYVICATPSASIMIEQAFHPTTKCQTPVMLRKYPRQSTCVPVSRPPRRMVRGRAPRDRRCPPVVY